EVVEVEVVRDRREERRDGKGEQARLDAGGEVEQIARLWDLGGAALDGPGTSDALAKEQEKEEQPGEAEVGRVLEVDVVDVLPGAKRLVHGEGVHSHSGSDDGVSQHVPHRHHL